MQTVVYFPRMPKSLKTQVQIQFYNIVLCFLSLLIDFNHFISKFTLFQLWRWKWNQNQTQGALALLQEPLPFLLRVELVLLNIRYDHFSIL